MTTISAFTASNTSTDLPAPRKSPVANTVAPADNANVSTVTLGKSNAALNYPLYSASMSASLTTSETAAPVIPPVWEGQQKDLISHFMAGNFSSSSLASRFHDIGAAMLSRFNIDSSDFSQSVRQPSSTDQSDIGLQAAMATQLHKQADNQISLSIKTTSGVQVQLTLGSQEDGLAVQIKVTDGKLNDAEKEALENLAGAFQKAIDGLAANPPKLNLGGLTQFNSEAIASIDLQASLNANDSGAQSIAFHADSNQRTVSLDGPSGSMKVNVDLSNPVITGSEKQQSQAINRYLKQFDNAANRGNGDAALMSLFKDAFTQMNSNYGSANAQQALQTPNRISLDNTDHAILTGLADFSASVTQTSRSPNPMRTNETDTFSYQVSQTSSVNGNSQLDRAVSQQQQSHLTASYHQSLLPGAPLMLTSDLQSQNYYYRQLNDSASSTANITYRQGALVQASLNQSASQSTRVSKYVAGSLMSDVTTPSQVSRKQDFLDTLKTAALKNSTGDLSMRNNWEQDLSSINELIYLESDPGQIRAQKNYGSHLAK